MATTTISPETETETPSAAAKWVKISQTCEEMQCGPSRVYEIISERDTEDPEKILQTFVFRSPKSRRGTRLFELNSVRKFMAWKYAQAEAADIERRKVRQAKREAHALEVQERKEAAHAKREEERSKCPIVK
jgi:hypothetical protein